MRVWQQIDDCIVVAGEGRIAYVGSTIAAAGYFEKISGRRCQEEISVSPAEFIIDFVTENDLAQFEVELAFNAGNSDTTGNEEANRVSLAAACALIIERTTWWDEFRLFAWRCVIEVWRHASDLVYDVIVHALAGALIGALYPHYGLRDAQQVGFMVQLSLGFTISISSARVFGINRETTWQELSTAGGMGLRPTAYVVAKLVVAELPRLAIFVAAFLATWYAPLLIIPNRKIPLTSAIVGIQLPHLRCDRWVLQLSTSCVFLRHLPRLAPPTSSIYPKVLRLHSSRRSRSSLHVLFARVLHRRLGIFGIAFLPGPQKYYRGSRIPGGLSKLCSLLR